MKDPSRNGRCQVVPLQAEDAQAAENKEKYLADNVFWVPKEARWSHLQSNARLPTIGTLIDDAMRAIEKDNESLKPVPITPSCIFHSSFSILNFSFSIFHSPFSAMSAPDLLNMDRSVHCVWKNGWRMRGEWRVAISGHTQVNATDLRALRYPARDQLVRIGQHIAEAFPDQAEVDRLVTEVVTVASSEWRVASSGAEVDRLVTEAVTPQE